MKICYYFRQKWSAVPVILKTFLRFYLFLEKKRQKWYGHVKRMPARGENTKINYGMDARGEKKKRTSKKNVD
jgi:hypothetical protein